MSKYYAEIYKPAATRFYLEKSGYIRDDFVIDSNSGTIRLRFVDGDFYITHISNVIIRTYE